MHVFQVTETSGMEANAGHLSEMRKLLKNEQIVFFPNVFKNTLGKKQFALLLPQSVI